MSQSRGQSDEDWRANSSRRGRTTQAPPAERLRRDELYSTSGPRGGSEFEPTATSSSSPTHSSRQHQVRVHRFEPDDDEEDDGDDASERYSAAHGEHYPDENRQQQQQDPYNSQPAKSSYYYATRQDEQQAEQPQHQLAYDSMSTILEVDSEDAASRHSYGGGGADTPASGPASVSLSERPRGLESPLEVRTTPGPLMRRLHAAAADDDDHTHYGRASAGSPVGRISPEDKFSGTLSALAAQMERLQQRGNGSVESSRESDEQETSQTTTTTTTPVVASKESKPEQVPPQSSRPPPPEEPRKVVAVEPAHKSTETNIDLRLMDKLVLAYFVERQDKATQSIKFDCDLEDEFDIVDGQLQLAGDGANSLSRRVQKQLVNVRPKQTSSKSTQHAQPETSQTGVWVRPQTRDASVGTEKFSRERFSLLPQTRTRATQTRPNLSDPDLGISETRRFKLSHLSDLGSMMMKSSRRPNASEQQSPAAAESALSIANDGLKTIDDSTSSAGSETSKVEDRDRKRMEEERGAASSTTCDEDLPDDDDSLKRTTTTTTRESKRKQTNATSVSSQTEPAQQSNAADSLELEAGPSSAVDGKKGAAAAASESPRVKATLSPGQKYDSRENNKLQRHQDEPQPPALPAPEALPPTANLPQTPTSQKIPTLKTELRVIIEFADSRKRQRNELKSNSQLIDGKLNKRTEISTSKHVAVGGVGASPRQVRDKLELAGQRHSILYNNNDGAKNDDHDEQATPRWHEISKSVVCNEIETDTKGNHKTNGASETPKREYSDIVMSSDATFRQLPDDKSALELRSRAAQRYASRTLARDDGPTVGDGERLLVESAAAFDESQPRPAHEALEGRGGKIPAPAELTEQTRRTWGTPTTATSDPRRRPISLLDPQIARIRPRSNTPQFDPAVDQVGVAGQKLTTTTTTRPTSLANELPRARYQSSPNLAPSSAPRVVVTPTTSPHRPASRIEFEEHKEDRRQVTRNGRLVYDDHLREQRRYETHSPSSAGGRTPTPTPSPFNPPNRNPPNQQRQGPLLKPIRLQTPTTTTTTTPRGAHLRPTQASPPALFADQTSNLSQSDDADTMDSGFAQSGVGSSHNLSQAAGQLPGSRQVAGASRAVQRAPGNLHVEQQTKRTGQTGNGGTSPVGSDGRHRAGPTTRTNYLADTSELNDAAADERRQRRQRGQATTTTSRQQDDSLTFVDDDDQDDEEEDELVEQLGATTQHQTRRPRDRPDQTNDASRNQQTGPPTRNHHTTQEAGLISPPSAFRSTGGGGGSGGSGGSAHPSALATAQTPLLQPKPELDKGKLAAAADHETELTTRLTRCKFKQVESARQRRRTLTKLDQILVAPNEVATWLEEEEEEVRSQRTQRKQGPSKLSAHTGEPRRKLFGGEGQCRFKAQVVFESDTDSAADRHSSAGPATKINRVGGAHLSAPPDTGGDQQQQQQRERKQLITETRYSLTNGQPLATTTGGARIAAARAPLQSNWDYSLRVNRMRGAKVDSKVNTYIKHSRHPTPARQHEHQPLINSLSG